MTNAVSQPQRRRLATRLGVLAALALLAAARPGEASAQWTPPDAQGNIVSTNPGGVGVGAAPDNSEGWYKVFDLFGHNHAKFGVRTTSIDGRVLSHDFGWWGAPPGMVVGTRTAHPLSFGTGGAFRMVVGAGGNVGIGTGDPAERLDVRGNFVASGNVGIGTTQAAEKLDVRGNLLLEAGGSPALFTGTGAGELNRYLQLLNSSVYRSASGLKVGGVLVSDDYSFGNPSKNDMVVKGSVGIGTPSPAYKLDVAGPVRSTAGGFVFPDGTTQTTAASTAAPSAASISAGQFGQNAGGGRFSFPAEVLINTTAAALIDTGASNRFRVCGPNGTCSIAGEYIGGRLRLSADGSFANAEAQADPGMGGINAPGNAFLGGNVGVGTAAPAAKLHVAGDVRVDGNISAKYQDVAEWVPSMQRLTAGTVVILDPERPNHVLASTASYDTAVAGVISEKPGLSLGEAGEGKALVATTGRVKVRVDATRAPVRIGDLLVTSDVPGVAMKSEPVVLGGRRMHAPGTIIGKALEPLASGTGEILVLLSLQ